MRLTAAKISAAVTVGKGAAIEPEGDRAVEPEGDRDAGLEEDWEARSEGDWLASMRAWKALPRIKTSYQETRYCLPGSHPIWQIFRALRTRLMTASLRLQCLPGTLAKLVYIFQNSCRRLVY